MKGSSIALILACLLAGNMLTGCADQERRSAQYSEYLELKKELAKIKAENKKPLVDMKYTDSGGQPVNLTLYLPDEKEEVQQIKDDEYVSLYTAFINTGGNIVGQAVNVFGNGYFSSKNSEYMWDALKEWGGGGTKIDSGGGAINLQNSANSFVQKQNTGSYFGFSGLDYIMADHESSSTGGNTGGAQSNEESTETNTTTTSGSNNTQK